MRMRSAAARARRSAPPRLARGVAIPAFNSVVVAHMVAAEESELSLGGSAAALRIAALEAELARAYVNLRTMAAEHQQHNESILRQLGMDDGAAEERESLLLGGLPNSTQHCHCNSTSQGDEGAFMPPFTPEWWTYCGAALGCISVAALA